MGFELAKPPLNNIQKINIDAFAIQIEEIQKILQDNMFIIQAEHECYTNRQCGPALNTK